MKLRNAYDQAQIAGLRIANKGMQTINTTREKVTDFATDQVAKYYLWQYERKEASAEKEFQQAAKRAEKEELQRLKARAKERKKDMIAALNAQERSMYESKHIQNETRKQELLVSLNKESEKLFGSDSNNYEGVTRARSI